MQILTPKIKNGKVLDVCCLFYDLLIKKKTFLILLLQINFSPGFKDIYCHLE
jgi:hypothetical protein